MASALKLHVLNRKHIVGSSAAHLPSFESIRQMFVAQSRGQIDMERDIRTEIPRWCRGSAITLLPCFSQDSRTLALVSSTWCSLMLYDETDNTFHRPLTWLKALNSLCYCLPVTVCSRHGTGSHSAQSLCLLGLTKSFFLLVVRATAAAVTAGCAEWAAACQ